MSPEDDGGITVMKFGGAALRDADRMRRIAEIVARHKGRRVVVASAMQGVTDQLVAALQSDHDESKVEPMLDELRSRHLAAIEACGGDADASEAVHAIMERLERLLYGIAYTQEVTPRLQDLVQTFGERLSVPVLAAVLRAHGIPAIHLDAEAAGIRSMGPFANARPDTVALAHEVPAVVGPLHRAGQVPVITGYYGVDAEGNATLFGRGGSDYVASLLGRALKASAVELWKDVAGFLTADPRAVPQAVLVPELGYDEAAELASVGAKVLHPRAVEPVEADGIPIRIRCFEAPDAPGSAVIRDAAEAPQMVRSIASKGDLAILHLHGPGMAYTPGVAKRVFNALADAGVNVLNMSTSQATFALLVAQQDADLAEATLRPLVGGIIQDITLSMDRSLICVVGRGLGETPGSAASILKAVADSGVNIEMISLGASDIAIDFIVADEDQARALQGIHDRFMGAA